jgi:hypothetical protein
MFYQDGPPLLEDPAQGLIDTSCHLRSSQSMSNDSAPDSGVPEDPNSAHARAAPNRHYHSARLRAKRGNCHVAVDPSEAPEEAPYKRRRQNSETAGAFESILGRRVNVSRRTRSGPVPALGGCASGGAAEVQTQAGTSSDHVAGKAQASVQKQDADCEDAVMGLLSLAECT